MEWSLFARRMKKQGVFLPISMNILMRRSINIERQAGKPEGWLMIFPGKYIPYLLKEELSDLLISEGFMIEHCKQDINRKQSFFWTVASKRLT